MIILKDIYVHVFTEEMRAEVDLPGVYRFKMSPSERNEFILTQFEQLKRWKKR